MVCRQPENRLEGDMPIVPAVVAKDELVEVGVDVLTAKAVIGSEAPAFQEGEYPMNPLEGNVRCHGADDAGIVPVPGDTAVGCVPVGDQRRARRDIGLDEGMDVRGVVNGRESGAPRQGTLSHRSGHANPSGQRRSNRKSAQLASSANRRWNSESEAPFRAMPPDYAGAINPTPEKSGTTG